MDKRCYNYRKIFKKPIMIYAINDMQLPFGIELKRLAYGSVCLLILAIMDYFFLQHIRLLSFYPIHLGMYLVIPYTLSGLLTMESNLFDGKTAVRYAWTVLGYVFGTKISKKVYCNDEVADGLIDVYESVK